MTDNIEAHIHRESRTPVSTSTGGIPSCDSLTLFLREIAQHELLTALEERQLAERIERGDHEALQVLVERNLRLVVSVAKTFRGQGIPFLDLIQEGSIGLIRAAQKFDGRKGCKFSTYAMWWIRKGCQYAIESRGRTIHVPQRVIFQERRVERAATALRRELARDPSIEELANETGLPVAEILGLETVARVAASLDQRLGDDQSLTLGDLVSSDGGPLEDEVESRIRRQEVRRALDALPLVERSVLELRYGLTGDAERSVSETGRLLGLARERVRQIEERAVERLSRVVMEAA